MSPHHPCTDAPMGFVNNLTLVAILRMRARSPATATPAK
jgi:hypothetical protein